MARGSRSTLRIGVDVGGSGIKAALVDVRSGELQADRLRVATPEPSTPDAVAGAVAQLIERLCAGVRDAPGSDEAVGIAFPAVVKDGRTTTAANVDDAWVGSDAAVLFAERLGRPVKMVNDADAAGLAEMRFGAGREVGGTVLVLTLGTGIGSALFVDGTLVPNTELGHIEVKGREAESWCSDRARKIHDLSWKKFGKRLDRYLRYLEGLLDPALLIVGGGVSRKSDSFLDRVKTRAPVVPAALQNEAGVIGAALRAQG